MATAPTNAKTTPTSTDTTSDPAIDGMIAKLKAANDKAAILAVSTSIKVVEAKEFSDAMKRVN